MGKLPVTWRGFADSGPAATGIAGYSVSIVPSTYLGSTTADNTKWMDMRLGSSASVSVGLTGLIVHGEQYRAVVSVRDRVQNERQCYSMGFLFDATSPALSGATLTSPLAAAGVPGNLQKRGKQLYLVLEGASDPESGLREISAAVGNSTDEPEAIR